MRNMAFKFRIYPNNAQAMAIRTSCGCRRFIYNWGLQKKQEAFQNGTKLTAIDLANLLPSLKKENPWLKEANSQSLQTALRDLDIAFTRFFKKLGDFPTWKKKGKSKDSFQVPQNFKIDKKKQVLVLPKLGRIKTIIHRDIVGTPKSVTVSMSKSGKFFASVLVEQDIEDPKPKPIDPATTIGIDVGISSLVVVSDGRKFDNPRWLRKSMSRLKHLQRQHSRKMKGSRNRERARIKVARQHEKVANQRRDFLHKVSHRLADENQVGTICVEDLNIGGMMGNHRLAGAIGDAAWGELFRQLEYKCRWRGINHVRIGRFEASSRLCPCGNRNDALTLKDRTWTCPKCGRFHDRDGLASNNIRTFGLAKVNGLNEKKRMAAGHAVKSLGSYQVVILKHRTENPYP